MCPKFMASPYLSPSLPSAEMRILKEGLVKERESSTGDQRNRRWRIKRSPLFRCFHARSTESIPLISADIPERFDLKFVRTLLQRTFLPACDWLLVLDLVGSIAVW